ncbi:F-box protein SKIP28 [Striga hermonthica]|uniref:F-box protein SKIP28 n=1 Tax=Striga hermonthica TaxID=68872 RepID=A0A9N7P2I1_STRHE|nr:F-box protein SKIP28 [Striga hermonthica]
MEDDKREETHLEQGSPPNEAIFFVLAYLPLFELLAMARVCKSLRDAINDDILPWLKLVVGPPLNWRLSDEILTKITSKAEGRLRVLALINCVKITDDGLLRVVAQNSHISKILVPGCTSLTPEGIIKAVEILSQNNHRLKRLQINGIYGIRRRDLETLSTLIDQTHLRTHMTLYHEHKSLSTLQLIKIDEPIDVDVCPKCNQVGIVYDCPQNLCQRKQVRECKGCENCIIRCVECGVCVSSTQGPEEALCSDTLCLDCWLRLPKCNFCNKPYCKRHGDERAISVSRSSGFLCDACRFNFN